MAFMKRLSNVVQAKANKVLDRVEDPRDTLDLSYEKQLEQLQAVRKGVADVATARKRIELQAQQLQASANKLQDQARQALAQNREDLAREALVEPSAAEGVAWDDEAVTLIVAAAQGYPYFLQQFGQETWNEAPDPPITLADARVGAARGRAALDDGFFRTRWDRATRSEQQYLRALAVNGDQGGSSRQVASRLGRPPTSLGPARASLISKGLIYAPEHGVVAFTVPGMAAFIQRQPDP